MGGSSFGLSNPYLKLGAGLIFASLAAIACALFSSPGGSVQATTWNIGGVLLLSGVVVYVIGRVVKARAAA